MSAKISSPAREAILGALRSRELRIPHQRRNQVCIRRFLSDPAQSCFLPAGTYSHAAKPLVTQGYTEENDFPALMSPYLGGNYRPLQVMTIAGVKWQDVPSWHKDFAH